jgi:hypothetical protein
MPSILTNKTKEKSSTITAARNEIFYRDDVRSLFGYSLTAIAVTLGLTGIIYVVGKKLTA